MRRSSLRWGNCEGSVRNREGWEELEEGSPASERKCGAGPWQEEAVAMVEGEVTLIRGNEGQGPSLTHTNSSEQLCSPIISLALSEG